MEIIMNAIAGIHVLRIEGDFLSEADHESFRGKIHSLAEEGNIHVVIDLAHVRYMNSCGLGSLVCALTTLRRVGGDLRLVDVSEHVRELLEITRLDRSFVTHSSLKDALQEFGVQMN